jgi:chromosome segregation ATPase
VTSVDDQFAKECSQSITDIEQALNERRIKETAREETLRKISQSILDEKRAVGQIEREYSAKAKEIIHQRENTIRPVAGKLANLRRELDRVIGMRTGFLRGISKKAKMQKTEETTHKVDTTKKELAKIEQSFVTEQERLKDDYRKRKQQILAEIARHQREIESLEAGPQMDDAIDVRRSACDALINAVNALLQRTELTAKTTNSSS